MTFLQHQVRGVKVHGVKNKLTISTCNTKGNSFVFTTPQKGNFAPNGVFSVVVKGIFTPATGNFAPNGVNFAPNGA